MDDDRITLDNPAVPFLRSFPSYHVGRAVIDSGPNATWEFACLHVEQQALAGWQRKVISLLTTNGVPAEFSSGDSPGADSYIYIGLSDGRYICVYRSWDEDTPDHHDIVLFETDGGNDGGVTIKSPTAAILASEIRKVYLNA